MFSHQVFGCLELSFLAILQLVNGGHIPFLKIHNIKIFLNGFFSAETLLLYVIITKSFFLISNSFSIKLLLGITCSDHHPFD